MKPSFINRVLLFLAISFICLSPLPAKETEKAINLKEFSQFVKELMKEWNIPGTAIGIVKDGRVIFAEGFGFRDIKKGLKVTPKTLFAIRSTTKAFTAVTMGILVDEGKLDWDKPVRYYLPTFKLKDSFATEKMTPRDLVCHRSGLPSHDFMLLNSLPRKELIHRLQYLEPSSDFRTTFQYQNEMFITAGYLVGQITGTTWEDFTKKRIFKPLGMHDSNFSMEDSKKSSDFALPYVEKDGKIVEENFPHINWGPAGSINSTVNDMVKWLLLNLNRGKFCDKHIISETSLREIHSPQMISSNTIVTKELFYSLYGMGWDIRSYRGHLLLSHRGGIRGFRTRVALFPHDNAGIVVLSNLTRNEVPSIIMYNIADRIFELPPVDWNTYYKKRQKREKARAERVKKKREENRILNTKPSHPLENYVGDYKNPAYGILSIIKEGDTLKCLYADIPFLCSHYHYDKFELKSEFWRPFLASFSTDKKGNVASIAIPLAPQVSDIIFTRMPDKSHLNEAYLRRLLDNTSLKLN